MATKKSRKAVGKSKISKREVRLKKVAKGLAQGKTKTDACLAAGYSEETAKKKGYLIVQYPQVQSYLTNVLEDVLAERKKRFQHLLIPFVDALDATLVERTMIGLRATTLPDHSTRMHAAEHLQGFYKPREKQLEQSPDADTKPPVNLHVTFVNAPAGSLAGQPTKIVNPLPPPQATRVEFVHGKR